jgi:hypothetical protein
MDISIRELEKDDTLIFYWFQRNRSFHIPLKREKQHYLLPSIIPGHYEIIKHCNQELVLKYKDEILFTSKERITYFEIKKLDPDNNTYSISLLPKEHYQPFKRDYMTRVRKYASQYYHIFWYNLHYLTYHSSIPIEEYITQLQELLQRMSKVDGLECPRCRTHLIRYVKKYPIQECHSKQQCISWFVNLHNDVNKRNHKKTFTEEETMELYKERNDSLTTSYGIDILKLLQENKLSTFIDLMSGDIRDQLYREMCIFKYEQFDLSRT